MGHGPLEGLFKYLRWHRHERNQHQRASAGNAILHLEGRYGAETWITIAISEFKTRPSALSARGAQDSPLMTYIT